MTQREPDPGTTSRRVSQTAPATKSASANVWRMLENDERFVEGMNRAAADFEAGRVVPVSSFLGKYRRRR